jgi:hypothetical protein
LKALEDENRRLKKLLAESMLDASTLKEMTFSRTAQVTARPASWASEVFSEHIRRSVGGCASWHRGDSGPAIGVLA